MTTIEISNEQFTKTEAIELVTFMTELKIRQQEELITHADSEEDIKMKESSIKKLQTRLQQIRKNIHAAPSDVLLSSHLIF